MIHILSIYSTIFNESIIKILAYKMAGGGKPPRGGNPPEIYGIYYPKNTRNIHNYFEKIPRKKRKIIKLKTNLIKKKRTI